MEDAATAEISRAQLWQWVHNSMKMSDGRVVDAPLVENTIANELSAQKGNADEERYKAYEKAANLMRDLVLAPQFTEFLTLPAYEYVLKEEKRISA
jgi:malate synthase